MTAYMIIRAEISDIDSFKAYAEAAEKLVTEFGGDYMIRGGKSECLEGDWPDEVRLVISKWSSMDHARAFWHSPEYQEVKKLRLGKAKVSVRLCEGL